MRTSLCLLFVLAGCPAAPDAACLEEDLVTVYLDNDGDGWGGELVGEACAIGAGQSAFPGDCDDAEPAARVGGLEECDDIDNDCDGDIDEGIETSTWFADLDGDGFGDGETTLESCADPGEGWTDRAGDCDDVDDQVNPQTEELCDNGIDDDCDDEIDEAIEICTDGIDNTCDDLVDCDDPQCLGTGACPADCSDATLANATFPFTVNGDTFAQGDDFAPSCASGGSDDFAYLFVAPNAGTYIFDTEGTYPFDTVLYALDGCGGAELACNDDAFYYYESQIRVNLQANQAIIVVVDGFGGDFGNYVLNVDRQ